MIAIWIAIAALVVIVVEMIRLVCGLKIQEPKPETLPRRLVPKAERGEGC